MITIYSERQQEIFVKHVCPPNDLDLLTQKPQIYLLVMTNHHTKLEDNLARSSLVIDRTRCVYGPTDIPTEGPTCEKQYTPTSSKGGIIKINVRNQNFALSKDCESDALLTGLI